MMIPPMFALPISRSFSASSELKLNSMHVGKVPRRTEYFLLLSHSQLFEFVYKFKAIFGIEAATRSEIQH